jgi:hypothetical protein
LRSLQNNLFFFWAMHTRSYQALQNPKEIANSVVTRTEFFGFIEEHCRHLIEANKLKESPFFDYDRFNETMKLIESYYKLDPELALLAKRGKL